MVLRIIGGEYGSRHLKTPPDRTTRPYTDRVRQIVFDRISGIVEGARVADVFSGVGTMGLEALSRGAASCVFIEGDARVHAALTENVSTLVKEKPTICWKTNIHRTSFCPAGDEAQHCMPYNLVFFDPPYDQCPLLAWNEPLGQRLLRLAKPRVTDPEAVVILRTPQRFKLPECRAWQIDQHWRISTMNLWVLRKTGNEASATQLSNSDTETLS